MSVILGHSGGSYPAFLPGQESRYKADFLHTTIATSSKPVEQRVYRICTRWSPFVHTDEGQGPKSEEAACLACKHLGIVSDCLHHQPTLAADAGYLNHCFQKWTPS